LQRRAPRLLAVGGAVTLLAIAAGCDDPFAPRANTAIRSDSFSVYAISGTPPSVPSAFNVVFFTPMRVDATYGFDVAFDIDAAGKVRVIPVRLMGGAVTAARRVGLQKNTVPFDEVTRAPNRGYAYDSVMVLGVNESVTMEVLAEQCQFTVSSQLLYSKIEILAVDPASRVIGFRITYDPNCGFRSFLEGVPRD
jgi:hypothetical protein